MTPALAPLIDEIARRTARIGRRVVLDAREIVDRSDSLALSAPGVFSANRSCRLLEARDGWIALNLARDCDKELIPAWTMGAVHNADWMGLCEHASRTNASDLAAQAWLLALPLAILNELKVDDPAPLARRCTRASRRGGRLRVVDLSSLWAGPLCGAVFARAGADVIKIESVNRPDPGQLQGSPHHRRLNGGKTLLQVDFATTSGARRLMEEIAATDVLVTNARPRALASLGIDVNSVFAASPSCVWVAITGHGYEGAGADRVAFGDDAAVAGGLVDVSRDRPHFIGDAIGDPLTGLVAAAAALRAIEQGGGWFLDAALARTAAGIASQTGRAHAR